jgi:Kef-type K+ transport system membrane component KefB
MLELGFNTTDFGKAILAACFVNDLGTVIALGLIFSPFTYRTLIFIAVSIVVFAVLPFLTRGSSAVMEGACRNWRQSTSCSFSSRWAD